MTPEFKVSWPEVFRPGVNKMNPEAEPKYSVTAIFAKGADLKALEKAAEDAAIKKWGENKKKWPANLRTPFRKCEEFAKTNDDDKAVFQPGHEPGGIVVRMTSKMKPGLIDSSNNDIISETEFYSGVKARATVRAYAYDIPGNKGIAFGLQNIQKLSDGEPLMGRPKAQDEFSPLPQTGTPGNIFE